MVKHIRAGGGGFKCGRSVEQDTRVTHEERTNWNHGTATQEVDT